MGRLTAAGQYGNGIMRKNLPIIDEEVDYPASQQLVSTTDEKGVVTYANEAFCQVAGFELSELVGQAHNIIRHPDMPEAAFEDLWEKLKAGQSWRGMVKNRCKDGRYYWVDAYVTPLYDGDQKVGFQSVRIKPNKELKQRAEKIYQLLNQDKNPAGFHLSQALKQLLTTAVLVIVSVLGVLKLGWLFLFLFLLLLGAFLMAAW